MCFNTLKAEWLGNIYMAHGVSQLQESFRWCTAIRRKQIFKSNMTPEKVEASFSTWSPYENVMLFMEEIRPNSCDK